MKKLIYLSILAVIVSMSSPLFAQNLEWQPTNGPWGGPVSGFVAKDSVILAGANTGTYRSTDNGDSWQWVFEPIGPFAIADSMIFAVANNEGIYRSKDNGLTWKLVVSGYFGDVNANGLNVIAVGQPTFRSSDGGDNWDTLPTSILSDQNVHTIAITNTSMIAGTDVGIFRSTDSGNTWVQITGPTNDTEIQTFIRTPNAIYAAGGADEADYDLFTRYIFLSTDDGVTWIDADISGDKAITSLAVIDSTVYVVDGWEVLYKSMDRAKSWTEITGSGDGHIDAVDGVGQKIFIATKSGGVLSSTNEGTSWEFQNNGIYAYGDQSIVATNDTVFVGTGLSGFFRTQNEGITWTNQGSTNAEVMASSSSGLYIIGGALYRSTDDGASWVELPPQFSSTDNLTLAVVADTIYAVDQYSTDDGATWASRVSIPENFDLVYDLHAVSGVVYATGRSGLYRSFDHEQTWTRIDTGAVSGASTVYSEGSIVYVAVNWPHESGALFRSTDYGTSWHAFTVIPAPIGSLVVNGNVLVAATQSGIYCSTNDGVTWVAENNGLTDSLDVYPIEAIGSKIYACTSYRGVFVANLPASSSVENAVSSQGINLEIFPNPFSAISTIRYNSSLSEPISITIIDPLGRIISKPLTEEFQQAGPHEIPIDARGLAPGIYLCRLSGAGIEEETKFVVER